jgi:predicted helicase
VKFIRFAQWKIDQAGEGVLGFITNHSYLDNPTFRGMRQSLMKSFNKIYLLDLHGNSLKKEKCPDGSKDENVFDIQQGVAICLFIKNKGKTEDCQVFHTNIWGLRENKYEWLSTHDFRTRDWQTLFPKAEFYLFIPRDERILEHYEKYPKITDVFPVNTVGIVTSRDSFVIDADKELLSRRIRMFADAKLEDELIRDTFHLKDSTSWKVKEARATIRQDTNWEDSITKILYRPFDIQWILYHDAVIERPRREIMQHLLSDNLSICFMRQVSLNESYSHILVSENIVDNRAFSSSKGIIQQAPLYLYTPSNDKGSRRKRLATNVMMLFEPQSGYESRKPNLSEAITKSLSIIYKNMPASEDIFSYIYAVLYSNIYRTKYAEFLRIDFPRIPFTKNYQLFSKMAEYGSKLVDLHLLKSSELDTPITKCEGIGSNKVEKPLYNESGGRVYFNQSQYFEGIPREVWESRIGGYQVCDKWLKDRKGRSLSLDDIKHYCRVATALQKTIEIQRLIDDIYPEVEADSVQLKTDREHATRKDRTL